MMSDSELKVSPQKKNSLRVVISAFFEVLILILLVTFLLRFTTLEFLKIESDSMSPTLKKGDHVLMSRLGYYFGLGSIIPFTTLENPLRFALWYKEPSRGDVIVFRDEDYEGDFKSIRYVTKQVDAIPGDTVNYQHFEGNTTFNLFTLVEFEDHYKKAALPAKGTEIKYDSVNSDFYISLMRSENESVFDTGKDFLVNGKSSNVYIFKNSYYFVTGENYSKSYDSRYFGPISSERIEGKVLFRYFSENSDDGISFLNFKWL
ncbi:MAG: signal peptidase I [Candidatus Kapabacteria bacterium]|nr:signal peptidase I [Candidatus Kapabacteria bacterium]